MNSETNPLAVRKCDSEIIDAVLATIEAGASVADGCARHGVGKTRFYEVIVADGQSERLKRAQRVRDMEMKQTAIETLRAAFSSDWRAAAWWLERNYPREFSTQVALRSVEPEKFNIVAVLGGSDA